MAVISDRQWDLSVVNRDGKLVLVVEVKSKTNVPPEWATKFRRNILAHGILANAPYFLMVFPDKFYLWTNSENLILEKEPDYTIDAHPILDPYFERAGIVGDRISGQSLEIIIASWLGEIIHSEKPSQNFDATQLWLIESGLYDALAGGQFQDEGIA
ncbi:hypothetical protein [Brunnivagina elsteri]|uniref:Uncharacterized protein n=1 Tax=Brunnivagina elsteri CCALA 953 TaxID=987040 RepID=A0A2A2TCD2_9CYAN|nr:hypothetical protein [Calothrix elsteri]PAX51373.1 hypothetical protein CK510_25140 [Calothrix elsteri CCALA 953]